MEIEYKGGTCLAITYKKTQVVTDPHIEPLGLKDQGQLANVQLLTEGRFKALTGEQAVTIDGPGEYEVNNCSIWGVAAHSHMAPDGLKTVTTYKLDVDGITIAILGHVAKLDDTQLEGLGVVDVLVLPVGGFGYSLEPKQAVEVVRAIEPKMVVPIHYADEGVKYEVPQAPLEDFLKELGVVAEEAVAKLRHKPGQLPEKLVVQPLARTK